MSALLYKAGVRGEDVQPSLFWGEDRCWDGQEHGPCSDACEHSSKQTGFWLQHGRFRQLQMVPPGLGGCWAQVFFCFCELWILADFLRYLLYRDVFSKNLSSSVLPCISSVCVWEKIQKVFMKFTAVLPYTFKTMEEHDSLLILYTALTENLSFDGKDGTEWGFLATEDEVKQESCQKIPGGEHIGKTPPSRVLVMQSQSCVKRMRELLRSQRFRGNHSRPPVWLAHPSLESL